MIQGATLGLHRILVKIEEVRVDQTSEYFGRIARNVAGYLHSPGTPRSILDKMNATAPNDLFVISPRWLAEQQLLPGLSYRLGFVNAAQLQCGPEPPAAALSDRAPLTEETEQHWIAHVMRWTRCADELRGRNQQVDGVTISALIADDHR